MISVVMATLNNERDLVEALSPLIPASVDGLVRELVVADGGSTDATLHILDEAGAVVVEGSVEAACRAAKGPWLLIMRPTSRLTFEWAGPVRRRLENPQTGACDLARGLFAKPEATLISKADYLAGRRRAKRLRI
jgi:glycosyltransferase involved in cell wall biosynthesis